MHCLFLNIASHQKTLAVVGEGEVLSVHETNDHVGDAELVALGEKVLQEAKLSYEDVTHLACIIGPGGFTSLRIAVAYANTLAHQLRLQAAGIHLSDLLHVQTAEEDHVWLHATRKNQVFARGFGRYQTLWNEPTLVTIEDLQGQLPEDTSWCGELLEEQQEHLNHKHLINTSLRPLPEVLPDFLSAQRFQPDLLTPWYGREG